MVSLLALLILPLALAEQEIADGTGASPATSLSDLDVAVRATYRFTEYPERACPAAQEYVRRGLHGTKTAAITQTVVPYCTKRLADRPAAPVGAPPIGRYTCLRTGFTGNETADDLLLSPGERYSVGGGTGTFDRQADQLTFRSGPWATVTSRWIGRYVPAGVNAKVSTIVIRDQRDVAAGNKRDLQWCTFAG